MQARTPKDLGLLIRDRRQSLQLDQRALAERVGVSRQWIVEVEAGKPRAEVGLILRTLTALGLDLDIRPRDPTPLPPPTSDVAAAAPAPGAAEIDLDAVLARAKKKSPGP